MDAEKNFWGIVDGSDVKFNEAFRDQLGTPTEGAEIKVETYYKADTMRDPEDLNTYVAPYVPPVTSTEPDEETPCDGGEACPARGFVDVDTSKWYHEAIDYVLTNGLMNGTTTTTFDPNGATTRGMLVTSLSRLEGQPAVAGKNPFEDVTRGYYYEDTITWAAANGIVNGYGDGNFGPEDVITREQMAAVLYRYAQYKGMTAVTLEENLTQFPDENQISGYAVQALNWAVGQELISGMDNGTLAPQGSAIRAQVATIFMRFCEKAAA